MRIKKWLYLERFDLLLLGSELGLQGTDGFAVALGRLSSLVVLDHGILLNNELKKK
jgi:hypothetical protein